MESRRARGRIMVIKVHAVPEGPVKVYWKDSSGKSWRIPANWRRRRVRLPSYEVLVSQGIPPEVARSYAGRAVSVNYHPGSLCCLPEQYRFRDETGNRWPVFIRDCLLLGYGDGDEYRACWQLREQLIRMQEFPSVRPAHFAMTVYGLPEDRNDPYCRFKGASRQKGRNQSW